MYSLFVLAANLDLWKNKYCAAAFVSCARYALSQTGKPVPLNLLPNGTLLRRRETSK